MFKNITLTLIYKRNNFLYNQQPEVVLKLFKEINSVKAVGIDNIGGKFLKYGATIFADITKLCILYIRECKIAKLKPLNTKKGLNWKQKLLTFAPLGLKDI